MFKMKEPKYVAATLKWCNKQRKKQGKKPLKKLPKGLRSDGESCPCGKATGLFVGFGTYRKSKSLTFLGFTPSQVSKFAIAFDDGLLPQYELCKK